MRRLVQYISDVHLGERTSRHAKGVELDCIAPILVVAGDLGNPLSDDYHSFLKRHAKKFEHVFIVAGNHDYYNQHLTFCQSQNYIRQMVSSIDRCSLLENQSVKVYPDLTIAGCTLWTKVDPKNAYSKFMYDHKMIKSQTTTQSSWSYDERNERHDSSMRWLDNLVKTTDTNLLVITHHVPTARLISKSKLPDNVRQLMVGECSTIFGQDGKNNVSKVWIFGHAHQTICPTKLMGWTFASNPCPSKLKNKTIEV